VDELIKESIAWAFARYPELPDYVREHAQAMDEEVMRRHIDLYVNAYTRDMGAEGRNAVENLQGIFYQLNRMAPVEEESLFL
jgi:1,4-dihydroxy-6-naphthoate synthase